MKIGIIYPQTDYGFDRLAIRDFAQTAESLGYAYIEAYEHVLGANPDRTGGVSGVFTYKDAFLEPFVLFSYLAAVTSRIGLATGILVLPMRQTALVAKQAATLDVLSGGRLRLGIGVGRNSVEYTSMNENIHTRGRRIEEQVAVLRALWTQPLVKYQGRWHTIPDAGINPLPVQQPVPIWLGGHDDRVLRRAARLGDGWMPTYRSMADAAPGFEKLAGYLAEAGRSASDFGIETRIYFGQGSPEAWRSQFNEWQQAGATHISLVTMGAGFHTPSQHMDAIRIFAQEIGLK